jgi:hypothetical protein
MDVICATDKVEPGSLTASADTVVRVLTLNHWREAFLRFPNGRASLWTPGTDPIQGALPGP